MAAATAAVRRCSPHAAATLVALTCALVPRPAAADYRTLSIDSLRVTVDSDWAASSAAPGYLPVRFDITNAGDERVIDVVGTGQQLLRSAARLVRGAVSVRRRVRLASGGRARFTMAVPSAGDTQVQFQIRDGTGRTLETFGHTFSQTFLLPGALIVATPGSDFARLAAGWVRTPRARPVSAATALAAAGATTVVSPSGAVVVAPGDPRAIAAAAAAAAPARPSAPAGDYVIEPARLPESWLGYVSLAAVLIGPREWTALDDAQRAALRTWIAAGGTLIVIDGGSEALVPDLGQRPAASAGVPSMLGRVHDRSSASIESAGLDAVMQEVTPGGPLPLSNNSAAGSTRGVRPAIPGAAGVSANAYLAILVLFSVVIGPANYLVLRRRRQQALIVLTTPLAAAVFISLLGGYVLVVEGLSVRGRAISFTHLDQTAGQAITRATVSLYAPGRAPAGGLRFPRDLAVLPLAADQAGPWADRHLDLTESQRFTGGLLEPRTPSHFETIGVRQARERLSVRREGATFTATNGLDATVERLLYRDGGGAYTLSGPLPPGASATLEPAALAGADLLPSRLGEFAPFEPLVANQPERSYLAVLDRSPFVESGVDALDEQGSFHLVLGTLGGEP